MEFDGAEVDVLIQFPTELEDDLLFQNPGFDVRMADGAKKDGVIGFEGLHVGTRQRFAGSEIAFAAYVEVAVVQFEIVMLLGNVEDFDRLGNDFRSRAVSWHHRDLVLSH